MIGYRSFKSACRPRLVIMLPSVERFSVVIIGVDPHKRTHTASSVEPATNKVLATLQIGASLAGYRQLLRWASQFPDRRWALENARGLGRHLAQWLVARGEVVDDVPSTATAPGRRRDHRHPQTTQSRPDRRPTRPSTAPARPSSWRSRIWSTERSSTPPALMAPHRLPRSTTHRHRASLDLSPGVDQGLRAHSRSFAG